MKKPRKKKPKSKTKSHADKQEPIIHTGDDSDTHESPHSMEVKGLLLLIVAILLGLSMWSFADHRIHGNWLGLIGQVSGFTLHFLFGAAGYSLVGYIFWRGIALLRNNPPQHSQRHSIAFGCLLISSCILLNMLAEQWTTVNHLLRDSIYSSGTRVTWWKGVFYLGGTPFHYLYHDLPYANLKLLLNITGIALVFGGIALASILAMANIGLKRAVAVVTLRHEDADKDPDSDSEPKFNFDSELNDSQLSLIQRLKTKIDSLKDTLINRKSNLSESTPPTEPEAEIASLQPPKNPLDQQPNNPTPPNQEEPPLPFTTLESRIRPEDPSAEPIKRAVPSKSTTARQAALEAQKVWNGNFENYKAPRSALLTNAKKLDQSSLKKDLKRQAEQLEETLRSFNIEAKVGQINCGPTITSFEVHPAVGVKVQRIKALENDIALNLQAKSIRIIAPIPGKAAVGIEIPNPQPQEVGFKELLNTYQKGNKKFHIPVLLGKTVNGEQVMADLAKMPHCIIAGATGSGKSVCINTIVMSILMTAKPDEIRLLMVDPKKVELSNYSQLPHMLAPVITEPGEACAALNWLVKEMENRYELLKQIGVRNIDSFNDRQPDKELEAELEQSLGYPVPKKLPFIVGIIDELADLMMVASSDIEGPIARIAQMARAVGIHLILATQRPSREVITGIIKANFPTRISFKVASRINSQIILDDTGAESLLGNGDMLFLPPGTSQLVRAQGAFIRDEDIRSVVKLITKQSPPNYVTESFEDLAIGKSGNNASTADLDSLYKKAYETVVTTGNASTTFLQRKLKIGYARAASIMDQLEDQGVLGPSEGSKPRKILVKLRGEDDEDFHGIE